MTANPGERELPDTPPRGRIPADTLSNRLTLARKLAGMTIEQAAEAAGLNKSSWANWETGRRPHGETEVIGRIADALDIDFNWLLLGGPLEGPRGRVIRPATRRSGADTIRYLPGTGAGAAGTGGYPAPSVRPRDTRPNNRGDSPNPTGVGRPTVVYGRSGS